MQDYKKQEEKSLKLNNLRGLESDSECWEIDWLLIHERGLRPISTNNW